MIGPVYLLSTQMDGLFLFFQKKFFRAGLAQTRSFAVMEAFMTEMMAFSFNLK